MQRWRDPEHVSFMRYYSSISISMPCLKCLGSPVPTIRWGPQNLASRQSIMTSPPQAGLIVFARWCRCTLPWGHIGTTWRIRLILCFLQPTRVNNPSGKAIFSRLTADCHWACLGMSSPSKLPLLMWDLHPIWYDVPWLHLTQQPKRHLDRFSYNSLHKLYTLQWAPLSPKLSVPMGIRTPI